MRCYRVKGQEKIIGSCQFPVGTTAYCLLLITACFLLLTPLSPAFAIAQTIHDVYFKNTDYELNVYKIYGAEKGKTMMIIGGIQGDEPGGYIAADLYADMALKKGNLIVVPRANFLSIIEHKRLINNDMNRRFQSPNTRGYYEDRVVEILKDLIGESDYLLNLHEGSGFFSERWVSDLRNPKRFGQSIIADADVYTSKKSGMELRLGELARRIAEAVNKNIENPEYHFKFNNHKTFERDTKHSEQRLSATYYAVSTREIPAFGIETSKEIKDIGTKVRFQTMVVNAFMEKFNIVPEYPKISLESPRLKYLLININGEKEFVVQNGESLNVKNGDRVRVSHVEANYARGLIVDFSGIGTANDFQKDFEINEPTRIVVKKDGFKCGEVDIITNASEFADKKSGIPVVRYLVVEINGRKQVLSNGEELKVVRGDVIKLIDVIADSAASQDIKINFLGFVGDKTNNRGEDRGYSINTANDLWIKYSKDGKGLQYPIVVNYRDKKIGEIMVTIEEPRMDYIVIRHGNGIKRWYSNGESFTAAVKEILEIVDVKTNVSGNIGIKINLNNGRINEGAAKTVRFDGGSGKTEIIVSRGGIIMGRTIIKVSDPLALAEQGR
ncbi:MAG TPA: hypothetical protein DD641_05140 [Deltaproteobacteria bacterium]|nr:hypothetical protein [Deltaproteobacteria bacterium]